MNRLIECVSAGARLVLWRAALARARRSPRATQVLVARLIMRERLAAADFLIACRLPPYDKALDE